MEIQEECFIYQTYFVKVLELKKNAEEGLRYLQMPANLGNNQAIYVEEVERLYKRVADLGNIDAMFNFALLSLKNYS